MSPALDFAPLAPWSVIAVLGGIGAALVLWQAVRGGRGALVRSVALAVLVLALANPLAVDERHRAEKDILLVMLDRTTSQSVGNRRQATADAGKTLAEKAGRFEDLEVRTVEVGDAGLADSATGGAEGTRLASALSDAIGAVPTGRFAGAVLITDGQVHDADALASTSVPGPVHVLLTGDAAERDRRLVVAKAPRYGIVGQTVKLSYRIEDRVTEAAKGFAQERVAVRILKDGEEVETALVAAGQDHAFSFEIDHAGPSVIEIEAAPGDGELSEVNNRAVVAVNGVRDRLRVLLVSGQPHAGERTWRNLLKADPSVDLVHFTILRPPEKDDFTPLNELSLIAFPVRELFEEKIAEFDLIVFDRYVIRDVLPPSYLRNIAHYVEGGGALLLAVGPEFAGIRSMYSTALGRVMPASPSGRIVEEGYQPRLTETGHRHPVTRALPGSVAPGSTSGQPAWGRWFRQIESGVKSGDALMQGTGGRPLLLLDRVAKGRVAQVMSDHIWLWARGFEGGGPQGELLRRLAHWLMKEPDLEEEALRARVANGKLVVERRSLSPEPMTVQVRSPAGSEQALTLNPGPDGRASAKLDAKETGLYRVSDVANTAFAASGALNPIELADLRATPALLAPLAKSTGGAVAWLKDGVPELRRTRPGRDTKGQGWLGLVDNDAFTITGVRQVALLPWPLLLTLVLVFLGLAWRREGR